MPAVEQRVRDLGIRREVQVREQHEIGTKERELLLLRLLHLEDEPGAFPHLFGVVDDLRAGAAVVVVGEPGVDARRRCSMSTGDVAMRHLGHAVGRDRDAVLLGLHLTRDADGEHC